MVILNFLELVLWQNFVVVQYLGLCIYFVQKAVKMVLENHSLKSFVGHHI